MNKETRAQIREKAEAATPGPWMVDSGMNYVTGKTCHWQHVLAGGADNPFRGKGVCDTSHSEEIRIGNETLAPRNGNLEDARFIATCNPQIILELLDLLDAAEEVIDFYANKFNWRTNSGKVGITPLTDGSDCDIIDGHPTDGKRAREFLEKVRGQ